MLVEFSNVPVSLDAMLPENRAMLEREIARACGISRDDARTARLLRKSVDARKKQNVHFVVTVVTDLPCVRNGEAVEKIKKRAARGVSAKPYAAPEPLAVPDCSEAAAREGYKRPIVVGAGPAGLFAALYLARAGLAPIVVERGKPVEERMRDVESFAAGGELDANSNVQFGEGGAGTFSDGKLNTGTKSPHIRHVLEEFVAAGAPEDILVDAKPHIGTDLLPGVVRNIRKRIEEAGGEFRFSTQLVGIDVRDGAVAGVAIKDVNTGEISNLEADVVILAIGHSARDTYEMLREMGAAMERKPFAVGVRIEHLQGDIDRAQYGAAAGHPALGAADYKLAVHNTDGRGVYTFCMCPGGTVVAAASEPGGVCVNGMSVSARDGVNSNSALLAEVKPEDLPGDEVLAGVEFQREMERAAYRAGYARADVPYVAPAETVCDFLARRSAEDCGPSRKVRPSYPRGVAWGDLRECLPGFVADAIAEALPRLDGRLRGFADSEAVMTGVEPRSSSPVRIVRDRETLEAVGVRGLYPAGEGAGYAGGIMSAAVDGLRVGEMVVARRCAG